jgi:glyoxylase-like metal-dependent hydrolase (beta-lactamase superfamily II)
MEDHDHQVIKINSDTYRINEDGIVNAYLLLGEKKALLIDSGLGVGNIREVVESLTKLPVEVALTHLHCDHAGGRNWFSSFAYHKNDNKGILYFLASNFAGRRLLKMEGKDYKLSKKPHSAKRMLFDDTCVFDLGGRLIRVMNTPGHTPGSTVWLPNAKKILSLADQYTLYGGHDNGALPKDVLQELVSRGEELVNGAKGIKVSRGVFAYPDNDWQKHPVIWYHKVK